MEKESGQVKGESPRGMSGQWGRRVAKRKESGQGEGE